ncbi:MAG: glycyl-radical enzyme activating protein [Chloroflexi bacterium]|nr:glycyl-radical enzyme activating protein [Chloroflexota bacterium]
MTRFHHSAIVKQLHRSVSITNDDLQVKRHETMTTAASGLVFNIQRFSIHDGPGIRTTVFLKGCPLRCKWCCNPESWPQRFDLIFNESLCNGCKACIDACPRQALTVADASGKARIWRGKCDRCLKCVERCPTGALRRCGDYYSPERVMAEIMSDSLFYRNSGGGVTFSGGEPLLQGDFLLRLLMDCKSKGLHTALETSGYSRPEVLEKAASYTDLILYDIKHTDPTQHQWATGKSNALIIKNVRLAALRLTKVWLRVPLIPGFNDTTENLSQVAAIAREVSAQKVSLLPYHEYGLFKYRQLGIRYGGSQYRPMAEAHVEECKRVVEKSGARCEIGR